MEELIIKAVVEIVVELLKEVGKAVSKEVVRRLVEVLRGNRVPIAKIPKMVVAELGGGSAAASRAAERAAETFGTIHCPVHDDEVEVLLQDGDWVCPRCSSAITVVDGEASHEEMLSFECPIRPSQEWVSAEPESWFTCPSCKGDLLVHQDNKGWKVMHQISITN